jgi:hypothetical protein
MTGDVQSAEGAVQHNVAGENVTFRLPGDGRLCFVAQDYLHRLDDTLLLGREPGYRHNLVERHLNATSRWTREFYKAQVRVLPAGHAAMSQSIPDLGERVVHLA